MGRCACVYLVRPRVLPSRRARCMHFGQQAKPSPRHKASAHDVFEQCSPVCAQHTRHSSDSPGRSLPNRYGVLWSLPPSASLQLQIRFAALFGRVSWKGPEPGLAGGGRTQGWQPTIDGEPVPHDAGRHSRQSWLPGDAGSWRCLNRGRGYSDE